MKDSVGLPCTNTTTPMPKVKPPKQHAPLNPTEPHPAAKSALNYIRTIPYTDLVLYQEAFATNAIEGNRLAEICLGTLNRLLHSEPVSDRYLLGLAWTLMEMREENK